MHLTFDGFSIEQPRQRQHTEQQGKQANVTGKAAETAIYSVLHGKGYHVEKQKRKICLSIYGTPVKVDLYVTPCARWPLGLAIESKWQEAGGSVDEKYPFLVANIKERYPCPCIVILDGGGYRPGAARWLRAQADAQKLLHVFTLAEFLTWSNRNL